MPRQARLDVTGVLRQTTNELPFIPSKLPLNPALFQVFINHVVQFLIHGCAVYAWALMDNHVHILFKSGKVGISTVMRKLLTWYALYFNRHYTVRILQW